jgi:Zn-dependent alcohol dehydrogenase
MASGERDVTLTIKVKDGEVTASEAKLKRLKAAANDVGTPNLVGGQSAERALTQQEKLARFMARDIPTAASKATAELQNAAAATSATGEAAATASVSIGAMVGAIALGVVGIAAFVFIVIKAGEEIFSLSKRFAEHALEVGKLSEEYGLATETVSALSAELEVQGRSFNDIKGPINEFRKLIGQAAAGSEDAKAKLKSLGIDGSKAIYDVDSAFKQAVSSIVNAKDPWTSSLLLAPKAINFFRFSVSSMATSMQRSQRHGN